MKINPKDLIPLVLAEFKMGGTFYRKEGENDDYSRCVAPTVQEFKSWSVYKQIEYRELTKRFEKDKRLFLNRNHPWEPMER